MSSLADTADLWWKNAIVYCLDVETFLDDDGDGTGDFSGLTACVDYMAGLGVTVIWLMPFHPTPNRDGGYDISGLLSADAFAVGGAELTLQLPRYGFRWLPLV